MAGLVAAFIFAIQMLNFPVSGGTSGHLLGGALAAVLVGPWTAILCMSAVLLVQGLLFADGGLSALGTNITLMGVDHGRGRLDRVQGRHRGTGQDRALDRRRIVPRRAALRADRGAVAFVALFEIGGTSDVALSTLMGAMVGWHVLIGIGEAFITASRSAP